MNSETLEGWHNVFHHFLLDSSLKEPVKIASWE